jgi:cobalt/nickel transport system ATP-binding protein
MQPELLLLDEPMAGLDANMQRDLLVVLEGLSARGITIVVATHDVDFAYRWADAVHLLAAGRCTASFAARQLPQEEAALLAAGQSLPAVVEVHRLLALRGIAPAHPVPQCMQQLLALLGAAASRKESAMETMPPSPIDRRSAA